MNLPYFELTGKVAMISGGATGIGKGIAQGLAQAGAKIVIIARRLDVCEQTCLEIQGEYGSEALAYSCDITDIKAIKDTVEKIIQSCGHIDILVNNAGIGGSEKPILKMTDQDWDSVLNTNLKSVFTLTREVVKKMVGKNQGGKIINIASIGAQKGWPNMSAYCAAKGGCVQLTKVMALEWASQNIQANAILPGYFETPMNTHFFNSDEGKKIIRAQIPVKRLAQVEEIKGVAILLASKASSFMTGSSIVIDGGQTSR